MGMLFLRVAPPWSQIEGLNHVLADPTLIRWAVPSAEEEENEGKHKKQEEIKGSC